MSQPHRIRLRAKSIINPGIRETLDWASRQRTCEDTLTQSARCPTQEMYFMFYIFVSQVAPGSSASRLRQGLQKGSFGSLSPFFEWRGMSARGGDEQTAGTRRNRRLISMGKLKEAKERQYCGRKAWETTVELSISLAAIGIVVRRANLIELSIVVSQVASIKRHWHPEIIPTPWAPEFNWLKIHFRTDQSLSDSYRLHS